MNKKAIWAVLTVLLMSLGACVRSPAPPLAPISLFYTPTSTSVVPVTFTATVYPSSTSTIGGGPIPITLTPTIPVTFTATTIPSTPTYSSTIPVTFTPSITATYPVTFTSTVPPSSTPTPSSTIPATFTPTPLPTAKLTLVKSESASSLVSGQAITYTLSYAQTSGSASNLVLSDTVPAEVTYAYSSTAVAGDPGVVFNQNGSLLTWTFSNPISGLSGSVAWVGIVSCVPSSAITNIAEMTASGASPLLSNGVVCFVTCATSTPTVSATPTVSTIPSSPTFDPTPIISATFTPTVTTTVPVTFTTSPTFDPTPIVDPTVTTTVTAKPSTTATVPVTVTSTSTPSSGCVTLGLHDPSPVVTITLVNNNYQANIYPVGSACGASLNEVQVFAGNFSSSSANMEIAVYDNTLLVADTTIAVPASSQGWLSASIPPVSIPCGDSVILVAHSQSATLFVGASSSGANCNGDNGNQTGAMPSTYPNPGALTSPKTGWCYEMCVNSCGSGSATATPTFTSTPIQTPPAPACLGATVIGPAYYSFSPVTLLAGNLYYVEDGAGLSGTVSTLHPSFLASGTTATVGLYSDNSGVPGTLLSSSDPFTSIAGWNSIPLNTPVNVTGGNNYWLAIEVSTNCIFNGGILFSSYLSQPGASLPSAYTGPSSSNTGFLSFYGDICP